MTRCTVCASPHRDKIDRALIRGESGRSLATKYKLGRGAVARHAKQCLVRPAVTAAAVRPDAREATRGERLLESALDWEDKIAELYDAARAAGKYSAAASAARVGLASMAFRLQVAEMLIGSTAGADTMRHVGSGSTDAIPDEAKAHIGRVLGVDMDKLLG